jgi:hypothetical protein
LNIVGRLKVSGINPMLEIQKARLHERTRLRAKGVTDDEIKKAQQLPFKPAFVGGKRRERAASDAQEGDRVPTDQFAFRRER